MEKITLNNLLKIDKKDLAGKIIIFTTDTVFGVGALINDKDGINKIYEMKKRDYGKPLAVLCSDIAQVESICDLPEYAYKYTKYWPGALTIIAKAKNSDDTIGVRVPNSKVARTILNHFGPMHVTSVNYSGEKELNDINEIYDKFSSCADYLVIDTEELSKMPSTVISCLDEEVKILRSGSIKI